MFTMLPLRLSQVGQRRLAEREDTDDVQLEDGAEVVGREVVDRPVRRVPAGVVDQAVDAPVPRDCVGDEGVPLVVPRHVAAR